jgi:hypothetical protein
MPLPDDQKREVVRKAWLMQETPEAPFMIEVGEAHSASAGFLGDMMADLNWQEEHCRDLAEIDDYFIPNLKPNLGIGFVAAAFGCAQIPDPKSDPWIRPIIGEHNPRAVYDLRMPDLVRSGMNAVTAAALERLACFKEHSRLPIRLVNVPSPLVTASLIWEYTSFVMATLAHPKEVHFLLDLVTEFTIAFVRLQMRELGGRLFGLSHDPWYLPPDLGIRISDDTAAVLSPRAYREYGAPYNARISEAFGGIVVHSCGDIVHLLPEMLSIPGLRGIDLVAPQNNWDRVRELTHGKTCLCLRYHGFDFPDSAAGDQLAYSQSLIECFGRRGVMLWTQTDTLAAAKELARELHRVAAC